MSSSGGSISTYIGGKFAAAAAIAAIAAAAVTVPLITGGGGGGAATANLWVDTTTSGNTCARTSGAGATYSTNAACNTFDAAWDASTAGDTIRVKNGTYARQFITGDKASTTKLIGESKAGVIITGTTADCRNHFGAGTLLCLDGDNLWVENVTVDANAEDGASPGLYVIGSNDTLKNSDILGDAPDMSIGTGFTAECAGCTGDHFTWDGGTWGDPNAPARSCQNVGSHGEPAWIYTNNVTINNVTFNKQTVLLEATCGLGNNRHLEFVRLESSADNLTLSNNRFMPGSDSGSGYIFYSVTTIDNLHILGNYFADNSGNSWMQSPSSTCSLVIAYNTFSGNDGAVIGCGTINWIGNLGPASGYAGCSGTHTRNVWGTTGSCGTDTFVGATSLAVDSTGHIGAGSPAIDAGETPGASDYCTDPAYLNGFDIDDDARPFGSVCDAGADEYTG